MQRKEVAHKTSVSSSSNEEKSFSLSIQDIQSRLRDETGKDSDEFKGKNLYEILGVELRASQEEISKAYRRLALIHHPDKGGESKKFIKIEHAYYVLTNEKRRAEYDSILDDQEEEKEYISKSFGIFMDENDLTIYMNYDLGAQMPPSLEDFFLQADRHFNQDESPLLRPLKKGDILYAVGRPIRF